MVGDSKNNQIPKVCLQPRLSKDQELLLSQRRQRRNSHVTFKIIPIGSNSIVENQNAKNDLAEFDSNVQSSTVVSKEKKPSYRILFNDCCCKIVNNTIKLF